MNAWTGWRWHQRDVPLAREPASEREGKTLSYENETKLREAVGHLKDAAAQHHEMAGHLASLDEKLRRLASKKKRAEASPAQLREALRHIDSAIPLVEARIGRLGGSRKASRQRETEHLADALGHLHRAADAARAQLGQGVPQRAAVPKPKEPGWLSGIRRQRAIVARPRTDRP